MTESESTKQNGERGESSLRCFAGWLTTFIVTGILMSLGMTIVSVGDKYQIWWTDPLAIIVHWISIHYYKNRTK